MRMVDEDVGALAEVHRQTDRRRRSVLQDERRQVVCVLETKTKQKFNFDLQINTLTYIQLFEIADVLLILRVVTTTFFVNK